jgi:dihydroflavonol-4-reductase
LKITVTGATGHIGNVLVRELVAAGHTVLATARHPACSLQGVDVRFEEADLRDPDAVGRVIQGAERVFHCGALIGLFRAEKAMMQAINVEGTRNVLAACAKAGVERLVHFSSIHAFEPSFDADTVIDENRA